MSRKSIVQKIDIKGWNTVIKELQKIKGGTYKDILRAECAEILSQTANRKSTKVADKPKIVGRHMPINLYFLGFMGRKEAYTVKEGQGGAKEQKTYMLKYKMPDSIWSYIKGRTIEHTQEKFGNWGLNKGQFALMATKLGIHTGSKPFPNEAQRFLQLRKNRIQNKVFAKDGGKKDRKYKM